MGVLIVGLLYPLRITQYNFTDLQTNMAGKVELEAGSKEFSKYGEINTKRTLINSSISK